ncbi:hypothetical protein [Nocardia pseudovaccinii]|uniref:hypothetical protein n=1 Tax=Nocardia pseudovaccinii TaxID=189540 RepID=UPI000AF55D30|nr:hypothetical protein [Nocardia pseudovaccinii]
MSIHASEPNEIDETLSGIALSAEQDTAAAYGRWLSSETSAWDRIGHRPFAREASSQ